MHGNDLIVDLRRALNNSPVNRINITKLDARLDSNDCQPTPINGTVGSIAFRSDAPQLRGLYGVTADDLSQVKYQTQSMSYKSATFIDTEEGSSKS